jgi:hypothetical protein
MFLAHQPPPPGLLQILMSAEKCQVNNITSHFFRRCTYFQMRQSVHKIFLTMESQENPVIFLAFNTDRLLTWTETEPSLRNVVLNKNRALGNVKSKWFYRLAHYLSIRNATQQPYVITHYLYHKIEIIHLCKHSIILYTHINATLRFKLRNFTPLLHDMFRPQGAIIRCPVTLRLSHCIKYEIFVETSHLHMM